MAEQKKTFDEVSIVIMVLLALGNDGAEIFFDLLAATVVGLPGEAIMEPINLAMDGVFTFWFFAKCGFGGPSILQLVDDLLELIGVPGRTICVVAGILIANNPKLAAKVEMVGAAALTGGAGALEAGAGEAAAAEEVAAKGVAAKTEEVAAGGGAKAETEITGGGVEPSGGASGTAEPSGSAKGENKELEREMETKEERPPEENVGRELFEQISKNKEKKEEENENEAAERSGQAAQKSNVVSIEQHAAEIKQKQQRLPKMIDVGDQTEEEEEDTEAAA